MKIFKSLSVFMMVFSLFLTSVVPANVHAVTVEDYKVERTEADQVLKDIFDRFHYALSVEWDQKDPEFRKNAEMELKKALKDSGLSTEQLQGFLTREILSGKIGQEYSRLLEAMKGADLNPEEASQLARDFMKISYSQGTSFNGDGVHHGNWKLVVTVVVVVVVTALIIGSLKGGKDHDDDHDHGCHYDCTDIVVVN